MKTLCILLVACLPVSFCFSQWIEDPTVNNVIKTFESGQLKTGPLIAQDGSGGAIFAWGVLANASEMEISAQKIGADGLLKYPAEGQSYGIGGLNHFIHDPNTNGTFNTWIGLVPPDRRNLYVQLNDANGNLVWRTDLGDIGVMNQPTAQLQTVSDGNGGVIIVWRKFLNTVFYSEINDLYIQRVNSAGVPQWQAGGLPLCVADGIQDRMQMVADGNGGAVLTWVDLRTPFNRNIYAQKINADGIVQWQSNGVLVCGAAGHQINPVLILNNSGGAIITWEDNRGARTNAYAQWVNGDGTMKWAADGVRVCDDVGIQLFPQIIDDGQNGAIIAWDDQRTALVDIYAQRIDPDGNMMWATKGAVICNAPGQQRAVALVRDGAGGAIIAWLDSRLQKDANIYAQLIKHDGVVTWTANGVGVAMNQSLKYAPLMMVANKSGGAIIAWYETPELYEAGSLRASRINNDGTLPVTLISFKGVKQEGATLLIWETSQETNSQSFEIERSANGKRFENIGNREAAGNVNSNRSYRFLDSDPFPGVNYYRLKQIDIDGKFAYSKMINVAHNRPSDTFIVYPSPGNGMFFVRLGRKQTGTVSVVGLNGRAIYRREFENQKEIAIDIKDAPTGSYVLQVVSGNDVQNETVLKH